MLAIKGLVKRFSNKEIIYPEITASKGDFVLVCGDSGAGKTTLCEIIAKFVDSNAGNIFINGIDIHKQNVFENLHYVSQFPEHNLIGPTCFEEIDCWIVNNRNSVIDTQNHRRFITEKLNEFYLAELVDRPIWKLSFGKKKALAFCALSAINRSIWVLDEPFAGLDKEISRKVVEMFKEFVSGGGIIIATSHTNSGFEDFDVMRYDL